MEVTKSVMILCYSGQKKTPNQPKSANTFHDRLTAERPDEMQ